MTYNLLFWISQAISQPTSPKDLEEWTPLVLENLPHTRCVDYEVRNCIWMGRIRIDVFEDEATFQLEGHVDASGWVRIPGGQGTWPFNVRLNTDEHSMVLEIDGYPHVWIDGSNPQEDYRLEGTIVWEQPPQTLPLSPHIGIVDIFENGQAKLVQRDATGAILLKNDPVSEEAAPPSLVVLRTWMDTIPPTLRTELRIQNNTIPQNMDLGPLCTAEQQVLQIQSELSYWRDGDGHVHAYIPVGETQLEYTIAFPMDSTTLALPPSPEHWPSEEYWILEKNPELRQIKASGLTAIDPSLAPFSMEPQRALYLKTMDEDVAFTVIQRGNPVAPPNRLTLHQTIRPQLNGEGFWIEDRIGGTINHEWQLQPIEGLQIQNIEQDNQKQGIFKDGQDQTVLPIRDLHPTINVFSSYPEKQLPTSTWKIDFWSSTTTLLTPSNWKVLYWDGVIWSSLLGTILNLCAFGLLQQYFFLKTSVKSTLMPWERILMGIGVTAGALIAPWSTFAWLMCFFFLFQKQKSVLFILSILWTFLALSESKTTDDILEPTYSQSLDFEEEAPVQKVAYSKAKRARTIEQQNQMTVQIGIASPSWQGNRITRNNLHKEDGLQKLLVLDDALLRWIAILAGICIVSLSWRQTKSQTQMVLLVFGWINMGWISLGWMGMNQSAWADEPLFTENTFIHPNNPTTHPEQLKPITSVDFLEDTWVQLILNHSVPNQCVKDCLSISLARITITPQTEATSLLHLWMEVHAIEESILPVPGSRNQWTIHNLELEGEAYSSLRQNDDGFLEVKVPKGVSSIDVYAEIKESVQLDWPLHAHKVSIDNTDWIIQGIDANGASQDTLFLSKIIENTQPLMETPTARWTQELYLNNKWVLENTIERDPTFAESAITLTIPRLSGEQIPTHTVQATEDIITVHLPSGVSKLQWTSHLPLTDSILLEYPSENHQNVPRIWKVACGLRFSCTFDGPPPTTHSNPSQEWFPTWHPYPTEQLKITVTPYTPTTSSVQQIKELSLTHTVEPFRITSNLSFVVESATDDQILVTLPTDVELESLTINGQTHPFTPQATLPILTSIGEQQIALQWNQERTGWTDDFPSPSLNIPVSNPTIHVQYSTEHYPIWATKTWVTIQPAWWISIGLVFLLALGLARHPNNRMNFGTWILLLFTFGQAGLVGAGILIAWQLLRGTERHPLVRTFIDTIGFFGLLYGSILVLTCPEDSIWFWNTTHLRWYTDVTDSLASLKAIALPRLWFEVLWAAVAVWLLRSAIPEWFNNLKLTLRLPFRSKTRERD